MPRVPTMAIFRVLRSLIRNPNPRSCLHSHSFEPLFSLPPQSSLLSSPSHYPTLAVAPNPFSFILRLTSSHPTTPSLFRRPTPFSGPFFLSSPAWKLSQSATPLYLRGREAALFPKDLLRVRSLPVELAFRQAGGPGLVSDLPRRNAATKAEFCTEDRFLNLPNLVSISRMVSGPFIGWMIMNDWYLPAFCGLAISGATDWLDGFLARKMKINSVYGSYLDPLADKVLIGCVAIAMVEKDLLHPGLVSLIVLRDVALVSGAAYKRASSLGWKWKTWSEFVKLDSSYGEKVEPIFISKVNTVFQLLLVAAALLQPELGSEDTQQYVTYLSWLVASTTVASAVSYGVYLRNGFPI